jgi:lipid-A-disaccharide synthase
MRRLVKIPYVGLCNIVTGKALITEILQDAVTVNRLTEELHDRLIREDSHVIAYDIGQQVRSSLGPAGGARNAAEQIIEMLNQ